MTTQFFVPDKINAGFRERSDTYEGRLAYIIYWDKKGVLRKENSWQGWRDQQIPPESFDNTPTEGFVLNKRAGGYNSGWNHRQTVARIYDPRGLEFEITIDNLLFILQHCNCNRGKGLEGKFAYAWNRSDLVLLPESCEEYRECMAFSVLQGNKFALKDLQHGFQYVMKDTTVGVYLGRHTWYNHMPSYRDKVSEKGHVFYGDDGFFLIKVGSKVSHCSSEAEDPRFADLVEKYQNSKYSNKVVRLFIKERELPDERKEERKEWFEEVGGKMKRRCVYCNLESFYIKNGILDSNYEGSKHHWGRDRKSYTPQNNELWGESENGTTFIVSKGDAP